MEEKTVLICCKMIEDEMKALLERLNLDLDVMWVDRGFHDKPKRLNAELQHRINLAEERGYTRILLGFGLCGKGAVGLKAKHALMAIPRFDDCINFLLCPQKRCSRACTQCGVMYMTRGWCQDNTARISDIRKVYEAKYGTRKARRLLQVIYGSYTSVSVIDTKCYPLEKVVAMAQEAADDLGLKARVEPGNTKVLEKLLTGAWDEDILLVQPGCTVNLEDFEWPLKTNLSKCG